MGIKLQLLMSVTSTSIAPENCGTETSALQSISVNRRGKKSEAVDGTHVRMAKIPCERETLCVGDFSALRSTNTKGTMVSQTRKQ